MISNPNKNKLDIVKFPDVETFNSVDIPTEHNRNSISYSDGKMYVANNVELEIIDLSTDVPTKIFSKDLTKTVYWTDAPRNDIFASHTNEASFVSYDIDNDTLDIFDLPGSMAISRWIDDDLMLFVPYGSGDNLIIANVHTGEVVIEKNISTAYADTVQAWVFHDAVVVDENICILLPVEGSDIVIYDIANDVLENRDFFSHRFTNHYIHHIAGGDFLVIPYRSEYMIFWNMYTDDKRIWTGVKELDWTTNGYSVIGNIGIMNSHHSDKNKVIMFDIETLHVWEADYITDMWGSESPTRFINDGEKFYSTPVISTTIQSLENTKVVTITPNFLEMEDIEIGATVVIETPRDFVRSRINGLPVKGKLLPNTTHWLYRGEDYWEVYECDAGGNYLDFLYNGEPEYLSLPVELNSLQGAVHLGNNKILILNYATPHLYGHLVLDTETNLIEFTDKIVPTIIPEEGVSGKMFRGGCLLPDGRVLLNTYGVGYLDRVVYLENDYKTISYGPKIELPVNEETIPLHTESVYIGGDTVAIFTARELLLLFNLTTNEIKTIQVPTSGTDPHEQYYSATWDGDDSIVFIPLDESEIIPIYTISTGIFRTIDFTSLGVGTIIAKWRGGIYCKETNLIIGLPYRCKQPLFIDHVHGNAWLGDPTTTYIPSNSPLVTTGGVKLPTAYVAGVSAVEDRPFYYNLYDGSHIAGHKLRHFYLGHKYEGGLILPDGRVLQVPHSTYPTSDGGEDKLTIAITTPPFRMPITEEYRLDKSNQAL